jgi:hypothetical protein
MTALAAVLLAEAQRLVQPLVLASQVDGGWELILGLVGGAAEDAGDPGLAAALTDLAQAATALSALQDADLDSWSGLAAVADAATKATTALAALDHAISDPALASRLAGLGVDLTGQLAGLYLRQFHTRLFRLAAVLTLIDPAEAHPPEPAVTDGSTVVRSSWSRDELHFDRIGPLLDQPWATLRAVYLPNDLAAPADAFAAAGVLFPLIGAALDALRLPWSTGPRQLVPDLPDPAGTTDPADPGDPATTDDGQADVAVTEPDDSADGGTGTGGTGAGTGSTGTGTGSSTDGTGSSTDGTDGTPAGPPDLTDYYLASVPRLTVRIPQLQADGSLSGTFLGLAVEAWSAQHPGATPGLVVELTGAAAWTATAGGWTISVEVTGEIPAFVVGPHGLALGAGITGSDASLTVAAAKQPPSGGGPAFVLGSATGSRLELGSLTAGLALTLASSGLDVALTLAASSGRLVIAPGDADGFLASLLPAGGLTAEFDAGLVVSSSGGIRLTGGAGLQTSRPVHLSLGSLGSVDALVAGVTVDGSGVHLQVGAGLTLRLGPVGISVDHLGVGSTVGFPPSGGNLGAIDVSTGFAGPSGLGLSLALGPVSGSGAMIVDPAHGRYLGALDVRVSGLFDLRLLGLLQTTSATGGPGFSLILTGLATFPGIPIGLGFEIDQAGGLIAINRRLDTTAVTAALTAGTLGAILDPGADVVAAVTGLERILPAADGVYVGGVMIGLSWGEPVLARILLAFLYDTSTPSQLSVLGTVSVLLPEASPLVKVHVDIVGRFSADPFGLDVLASLRDSTLAGMVLSGDVALQLHTGDNAVFLLSLGGFHPSFTPPAGFPSLRRMSLALPSNPLLQLSLTGYFAVTANTLQFGASLHFWAGIHDVLGVAGDASFDALISWDPLHFEAALNVDVHVEVAGHTLFGATLKGSLSGPGPWHVEGGVYVEVLWWEAEVYQVDTDVGSAPAIPPPAPVDPAAVLADAVRASSSWSGTAPVTGVVLGQAAGAAGPGEGAALLVSPATSLSVVQDRVPLGLQLDHVGGAPAGGSGMATLGTATIGGIAAGTAGLNGLFAPAQFLQLSDDEALSRPSFESMPAGLALRATDAADPGSFARVDTLAFDTIPAPPAATPPAFPVGVSWQVSAPMMAASWEAPSTPVTVSPQTFMITSTATLAADAALTPAGGFASRTMAAQALAAAGAAAGTLQVTEMS